MIRDCGIFKGRGSFRAVPSHSFVCRYAERRSALFCRIPPLLATKVRERLCGEGPFLFVTSQNISTAKRNPLACGALNNRCELDAGIPAHWKRGMPLVWGVEALTQGVTRPCVS